MKSFFDGMSDDYKIGGVAILSLATVVLTFIIAISVHNITSLVLDHQCLVEQVGAK